MRQTFTINATLRDDTGKGASRRLRHANNVPGIVYGVDKQPMMITVGHNHLQQLLKHESFYTSILDLDVDGNKESVVLRDLQRHSFKPVILHIDLQRINAAEKIIMKIPFHFVGAELSPGVKVSGGLVSHPMTDVEVRCLPKDLPEFIEVDLSKLQINEIVHLSDLKLSKDIEIVPLTHNDDKPVATIYARRVATEESTAAPEATEVPVAGADKAEGDVKADAEAKK